MARRKVLIVGWDSADWRLLEPLMGRGLMPALSSVVERGVRGNLAAFEPILSPLLWTSMATGKLPHKHGVLGFVEPDPATGGVRNVGSGTRTGKALWNLLGEAGLRTHFVGWFASHPAESINGICVSERFPLPLSPDPEAEWPVAAGSVSPPEMAGAMAELRVHPREIGAADMQPFLAGAGDMELTDPIVEEKLVALRRILAQTATIHNAATWILETQEWDVLGVYFRGLDEFGHHFMPYHPPLLPAVDPTLARHFSPVMETACVYHDLMLRRLLALAGPEATVMLLSDHGFESGARRPGPVANELHSMAGWHRPFGVFALAGNGIREHDSVYGASVLDVTPTVLHLCGLPVGRDMDGKVLTSAFTEPQEIRRIDSWEPGGVPAPAAPAVAHNVQEEQAALAQLAALGYIDLPVGEGAGLAVTASAELRLNRISSLVQGGKLAEALEDAQALAADIPADRRFRLKVVQVLIQNGRIAEATTALDAAESDLGPCAAIPRMRANLHSINQRPAAALDVLETLETTRGSDRDLHEHIGRVHLQMRQWPEAERRLRAALALDPDSPHALAGLSAALARQERNEEAMEAALAAISLQHFLPAGHFQLGAILSKLGHVDRALQSFQTGLAMEPGNALARRYLTRLSLRSGERAQALYDRHVGGAATPRPPSPEGQAGSDAGPPLASQ